MESKDLEETSEILLLYKATSLLENTQCYFLLMCGAPLSV